jgi:hypothetical protein
MGKISEHRKSSAQLEQRVASLEAEVTELREALAELADITGDALQSKKPAAAKKAVPAAPKNNQQ